jgi:hypothetical protein
MKNTLQRHKCPYWNDDCPKCKPFGQNWKDEWMQAFAIFLALLAPIGLACVVAASLTLAGVITW